MMRRPDARLLMSIPPLDISPRTEDAERQQMHALAVQGWAYDESSAISTEITTLYSAGSSGLLTTRSSIPVALATIVDVLYAVRSTFSGWRG